MLFVSLYVSRFLILEQNLILISRNDGPFENEEGLRHVRYLFVRLGEQGALIIAVRRSWVGSNRKRSYDSRLAIVVRCTLDTICWTYLEKRGKSRLRYLESPGDCPANVAMKIVCEKKLDESYINEKKI